LKTQFIIIYIEITMTCVYQNQSGRIRKRFVMTVARNKARIPKQKRGIESRKIIKAAMALFTEKIPRNKRAGDCARAEVATGTFYSYFNNKKKFYRNNQRIFKKHFEKVLLNWILRSIKPG